MSYHSNYITIQCMCKNITTSPNGFAYRRGTKPGGLHHELPGLWAVNTRLEPCYRIRNADLSKFMYKASQKYRVFWDAYTHIGLKAESWSLARPLGRPCSSLERRTVGMRPVSRYPEIECRIGPSQVNRHYTQNIIETYPGDQWSV